MHEKKILSFCICLRNDNYGGDQDRRFQKFIDYYSKIQKKYGQIFEFVICDYNSPSGKPVHEMHLPWHSLRPLKIIRVNSNHHKEISKGLGRPILDYVGRNIAVRHACGDYILILNQDIFITESIFEFCAQKKLRSEFFYRADRWDIPFESLQTGSGNQIIANAKNNLLQINRRHSIKYHEITVPYQNKDPQQLASAAFKTEKYDSREKIIYGSRRSILQKIRHMFFGAVDFESLGLHTNASGDFILCPKIAWEKIGGAIETTEFYLHTDSYLVAQLYGAGYRQAIFDLPHQVFHADHDRSARLNFQESIPYEVHKKRLADIALGTVPPRLNKENWGMHDKSLEVIEI